MSQEKPWRKRTIRRSPLEAKIDVLKAIGATDRMTHVYYIVCLPSTKVKEEIKRFLELGLIEHIDEGILADKRLITYYKRTARGDEALALWEKLREMIGCQE
jgi:predicted transcriptional regulator